MHYYQVVRFYLEEARARALRAQKDANRLESLVQEQLSELEGARWELLMIDFAYIHMPIGFTHLTSDWTEPESFPEYLQGNLGQALLSS